MNKYDDRQIKTIAARAEYKRVFDNFNLPPKDIHAYTPGGHYVRIAWQSVNNFGWGKWQLTEEY